MPYSQTTQAQFIAAISLAMEDPNNLYWSTDEISRALNEALLHWGALTSYWRDRGTFSTTPSTPFYDLAVQLPTLRARTYTVDQICREVQYALFELANGVTGTGLTAQFTATQITNAIIAAADQFNIDATLPLIFTTFNLNTAVPDGRIPLDQSIVAIARVAYKNSSTGIWTCLRREDEWSAQSISPQWNLNAGEPVAYAMADTPPLTLQLFPPPQNTGQIHILYSESLNLTITGPGSFLDIPDEFALTVKWYALYLLLNSYSEAYDPYRAKYAYERYQQLVSLANSQQRSVNRVQFNGQLIPLDTIWNLDAAIPQWMNQATGTPYSATAWDILAIAPGNQLTGGASVLCDVVRSAPLPLSPTDFIQLGREELTYIMDYARHILSFKLGGAEFGATFPLFDNFLSGAKQRNQMLSTRVRYLTSLFDEAKTNDTLLPAA